MHPRHLNVYSLVLYTVYENHHIGNAIHRAVLVASLIPTEKFFRVPLVQDEPTMSRWASLSSGNSDRSLLAQSRRSQENEGAGLWRWQRSHLTALRQRFPFCNFLTAMSNDTVTLEGVTIIGYATSSRSTREEQIHRMRCLACHPHIFEPYVREWEWHSPQGSKGSFIPDVSVTKARVSMGLATCCMYGTSKTLIGWYIVLPYSAHARYRPPLDKWSHVKMAWNEKHGIVQIGTERNWR